MRYLHFRAHGQFPPDTPMRQAIAAERAGFAKPSRSPTPG